MMTLMEGGFQFHGRLERTLDPMSLIDSTQLALETALRGSSMRQELLTNNLANTNTPGYQRQDLDFHAALQSAQTAGVDPTDVSFRPATDPARTVRADGSGLDADQESAALAKNTLEYQALVQVMDARTTIMQIAMGVR
jgi:flagellar basal-body rod protein FlgB